MKKRIFIAVVCILVGILIFQFLLPSTRQSIHSIVQEGIQLSKNGTHGEARAKYCAAKELLEKQGYFFVEGEIDHLNSLINEFKTKTQKPFERLLVLFPKKLQQKINDLKNSKEIDQDFIRFFYKVINKLLKTKNLEDKLEVGDFLFPDTIKNSIDRLKKHIIDKKTRILLNRFLLAGYCAPYFPVPLRNEDLDFNIAFSYYEEDEYESAKEILKTLIPHSEKSKAYILLARIYEQKGELKEAIKVLEIGKENFQDAGLMTELAAFYFKTDQHQKSEAMLHAALEINPEYQYALINMQALDRKDKQKLKSSFHYKKLLNEKPNDPYLLSNLAMALMRENKMQDADIILTQGINANSNDFFLLKLKGRIEGFKRNYKEALKYLLKAQKNSKEQDSEIPLLIGLTYFNQHLDNEAYNTIKQGLKSFPDDPYLWLNLGKVCEVFPEKQKEALASYEKYLQLVPNAKNKVSIQKKVNALKGDKK